VLSIPSGYQRDLQATKAPFVSAVDHGLTAVALLPKLIRGIEFDKHRMRAAISPEMYATDRALELALAGVPFREAYREVGRSITEAPASDERTPESSLAARVSLGACGALGLERLRARLDG